MQMFAPHPLPPPAKFLGINKLHGFPCKFQTAKGLQVKVLKSKNLFAWPSLGTAQPQGAKSADVSSNSRSILASGKIVSTAKLR